MLHSCFRLCKAYARHRFNMEKTEKSQIDPAIRRRIQDLINDFKPNGYNPDLVEDILINGLKLLTDVQDRGDVRVIRTALREMRYSYRLFAPYAQKRKVTIFGSARTL